MPINPMDPQDQQAQIDAELAQTGQTDTPFVELGDSGLQRYGGFITEEWFRQAKGKNGILLIQEMRDNHPVIGAILFAIRMLMRGVTWHVESASDKPQDVQAAELLESCLSDMEISWQDTLDQLLSFIEFGWSWSEIVYKVRQGPNETDPSKRSQFTDKKVGIRKIAIRSQDSLFRFEMDSAGTVLGMVQQPPQGGGMRFIPRKRSLHLRPSAYKDNPLGRSAIRNAMVPYLFQKKMQEIEAIGIERDLAGYPVIRAPGKIMQADASPQERRMASQLRATLKNIRRDSSEGIMLPSDTDDKGNKLYDLQLLTSGGTRQLNPDTPIVRYDQRIAMVVLADFVMIGNSSSSSGGSRGSYGMAEAKQDMFSSALSAWLDAICEEYNRQVVPEWVMLNNLGVTEMPRLVHGEVQSPNLAQLASYITSLSGAGMPLFPDDNLERYLRNAANFPDPSPDVTAAGRGDDNDQINPVGQGNQADQQPQPKPAAGAGGSAPSGGASAAAQSGGTLN